MRPTAKSLKHKHVINLNDGVFKLGVLRIAAITKAFPMIVNSPEMEFTKARIKRAFLSPIVTLMAIL
jgi:hypothetical protein